MSVFDIPNAEAIPQDLGRTLGNVRYLRRPSAYRSEQQIRASSFPVCPKAYHIFRRTPYENRPVAEEKFSSEAATLMGTALHLALQKWFAIQGYLYGNWVCVYCNKIRRHRAGMQVCQGCGREMTYHEYEIPKSDKVPFSGHVDGILKYGEEVFLIDFKGSNAEAMREIRQKNKPKETHYLQVNAYANAINMNRDAYGGIAEIKKVIIIYVDRSLPGRSWHPVKVPVSEKIYNETMARIKVAFLSLKDMVIPRGLCLKPTDEYGKYCPWKQICFSPALEGLLSDKVEPIGPSRPSHSERELLILASHLEPGIKLDA
jgi:hypothetical protein